MVRLLLFVAWLTTAGFVHTTGPCPIGRPDRMFLRGQSCYEFDDQRVQWIEARRLCQLRVGRLVFIPNAETQSWLGTTAARVWPNQNSVWIGSNKSLVGSSFTWDHYNGTAQLGSFYNWDFSQNPLLSFNVCVAMQKPTNWRWRLSSCSSNYYTFVCEYPAAMITSLTVLAKSTAPTMLENKSSSAVVSEPNNLELATFSAEITNTTMEKDQEKNLMLTVSISLCMLLLVIAAVLIAVFINRRKRQSKHSTSAEYQSSRVTQVVNNPSYATVLSPDDPMLEPGYAMEMPSRSGYTYIGDVPTTEGVMYVESFDDVGHTYAEPLEPWPSSGGNVDHRTTSNEERSVQRDVTDGHVDVAHVENEHLAVYMNGAPINDVSSTAIPREDVYVEVDSLVSPCSNADRRLPNASAVYRYISDCQSNDCLTDNYALE